MKYALFEFVNEKSCEVGETRWITKQDSEKFDNDSWDCKKTVIVAWPRDFSKIYKKMIKQSIDPELIPTTSCVARVLQFRGKYVILLFMY